jgi:hypothetical protein
MESIMSKTPKIFFLVDVMLMVLCVAVADAKKPKVLYVNSYHKTFEWCDSIERGLFKSLSCVDKDDGSSPDRVPVSVDSSQSPAELVVWRMDSKRNTDTAWRKAEALKIMAYIKTRKPDVVLLSDDNAAIFLGVPYLLDALYAYQALITCANMDEEQGGYMGRTALRILNGERPEDIPLVTNKSEPTTGVGTGQTRSQFPL